jgi:hypothetical protein
MARHTSGVRDRLAGRRLELAARLAVPVLGLAIGVFIVETSPDRDAPLWLVWAPLAVALSAAGGAVFSYGWRRWADLRAMLTVGVSDVAAPIGILIVVSLLPDLTLSLPGPAQANWRSSLLVTFATLAAVPAASVAYGVRYAALGESLSPTKGGRLEMLIGLRRLLDRLLSAVGPLVALATLELGTLMALERSVHHPFGNRPPEYVLIFGGVGSLLVALVYVPPWAALREAGYRLCDQLFPIRDLDQPPAILSMAGDRQKLEQILGLDHSVLGDLQTGVAILSPLLASAAAAFLPH